MLHLLSKLSTSEICQRDFKKKKRKKKELLLCFMMIEEMHIAYRKFESSFEINFNVRRKISQTTLGCKCSLSREKAGGLVSIICCLAQNSNAKHHRPRALVPFKSSLVTCPDH